MIRPDENPVVQQKIREAYAKLKDNSPAEYAWLKVIDDVARNKTLQPVFLPWIKISESLCPANKIVPKYGGKMRLIEYGQASYNAAAWCKMPTGGFTVCPPKLRMKWLMEHGGTRVFTGLESVSPYSRIGFRYLDKRGVAMCTAAVFFQLMRCTTCCCTKGLMIMDKSLSLTGVNSDYPESTPKQMNTFCAAWFATLDPLVGVVFAVQRTLYTVSSRVLQECL